MVRDAREVLGDRLLVLAPSGSEVPTGVACKPLPGRLPSSGDRIAFRLLTEIALAVRLTHVLTQLNARGVVVSSPLFIPTLVLTWYLRRAKIPYVLDIRDPYPLVYAAAGIISPSSLVYRLLASATARMYSGAERITCATKGLAQGVREAAPSVRVITQRNGHQGADVRQRRRPDNEFVVGCHGNFGAFQDAELISSLIRSLVESDPRITARIIGRGGGKDRLAESLADVCEQGRVSVVSAVAPDELPALIEPFDIGLSIRGADKLSAIAFPVRITDYFERGVPVVVSPPSEAGRLVERLSLGGVFEAGELDRMADFVLDLVQSGERYGAFVERVRAWAPAFSQKRTMRRFRGVLQAVFC